MDRATTIEQWEAHMAEYAGRRDAAMAEANVRLGDIVEYHSISPWMSVEILSGVLTLTGRGRAVVKVGRKSIPWHKGFRKVAA